MFIHEAIQARNVEKPFIAREAWSTPTRNGSSIYLVKIVPTDTPENCIIFGFTERKPSHGWQPSASDLTADDWIVTAE